MNLTVLCVGFKFSRDDHIVVYLCCHEVYYLYYHCLYGALDGEIANYSVGQCGQFISNLSKQIVLPAQRVNFEGPWL